MYSAHKMGINTFDGGSVKTSKQHRQRIFQELRDCGLTSFGVYTMESSYLPLIVGAKESIRGAVFGYQDVGFVMLVATDKRIIFLDRKPFFTSEDEVRYEVVSGVKLNNTLIGCTLVLHTRVKDYRIFTFNRKAASKFVSYIETNCLSVWPESY